MASSAPLAAPRSLVAARATRAGAPASTMAIASPSRAEPTSSRAPRRARSKRVPLPEPKAARMLIESSTTIARATDAPPSRLNDNREQRISGDAPRSARATTAAARSANRERSSRRERRRARGGAGGTRCAAANGLSSARRRRRRCARYGTATNSATARPSTVTKLTSRPPRRHGPPARDPRSSHNE